MKKFILGLMIAGLISGVCEAKPRKGCSYTSNYSVNNATAQGVAETMASRNNVGHFGGNSGYEGCGSGMTQQEAYNNCCFANSGMTTIDVGYAQSRSGKWYCCRRYSR